MTIFGWTLIRTRDADADNMRVETAMAHTLEEIEYWKAKYYYAKARAVVAERFVRRTDITVWPVAMGVDSGVRFEVGTRMEVKNEIGR